MTLSDLKELWEDTPDCHKYVSDTLTELVNASPGLKAHRDFVEANAFGFGERPFHWLWQMLISEMPQEFEFLEVGVFRGQVLSLVELIASWQGKVVWRTGVTPLDSTDGHWESDYRRDIEHLHETFDINLDYTIIKGLSTDKQAILEATALSPYDIVYIDGGHKLDVVRQDLKHYPEMVKRGGYLVIDDACCDMHMPFGFFQGIEDVTKAVLEWEKDERFEFTASVVHNRIYRRIK